MLKENMQKVLLISGSLFYIKKVELWLIYMTVSIYIHTFIVLFFVRENFLYTSYNYYYMIINVHNCKKTFTVNNRKNNILFS